MHEILFYDVVSPESTKAFLNNLKATTDPEITLRLNSPGGSVFDADVIYNAILRHPSRVIVEIDGLAASAASYIAMAGDEVRIAENGMVMVHLAHGATIGNRIDHLKQAEVLKKLDDTIAAMYAKKTGRQRKTWLNYMEQETWFNAQEAQEAGLVDKISKPKKVSACFDSSMFKTSQSRPRYGL